MNVGTGGGDEDEPIATINTTPLVDVMMVQLIIFLITVPVVRSSIPVQLPKERNEIRETKPENIVISVDEQDHIYWNELRMPTTNALVERLKKVSVLSPQPEVQIRGDGRGNYDGVGRVVYACQLAGISKIAFITEPPIRATAG
jgi:biopolymer transport protein ExbD